MRSAFQARSVPDRFNLQWRRTEESNPYVHTSPVFRTGAGPLRLHPPKETCGLGRTSEEAEQRDLAGSTFPGVGTGS